MWAGREASLHGATSFHEWPAAVRRAIEATGADLRFLPPYNPDLNPIEMAFSKLKAFLKSSPDSLWQRSQWPSRSSLLAAVRTSLLLPDMTSNSRLSRF